MKNLLKNVNNKKIKLISILTILFFIYIYLSAYSYVYSISSNLSNAVFRLHIIANSNSEEDQSLKYKVRDNLINYMNTLCKDCTSKEEIIKTCEENKVNFKKISDDTIQSEGFDYDTNIKIGHFMFPTKSYGDISLPSGMYDALRVEIGNSKGKNWWCVLYPSLCFVDMTSGILPDESKENLQESLSDEEYSVISNSENNYFKFKFKIIELFNNNPLLTAKNNI